jgi:hypothetical protein
MQRPLARREAVRPARGARRVDREREGDSRATRRINAPARFELETSGSGTILSCMHQPVEPKILS